MKTQKLQFWAGNPCVSLIDGELLILPFSNKQTHQNDFEIEVQNLETMGSRYLCCPNVPVHISIIEFSDFISPVFTKQIQHLRVLQGQDQDSYIIVIKLVSTASAIEFVDHYHCKAYNDIEPESCHLALL